MEGKATEKPAQPAAANEEVKAVPVPAPVPAAAESTESAKAEIKPIEEAKKLPEEEKKLGEEAKRMPFDPKNLKEDQVKSMFENLEKYMKDPKSKEKLKSMKEMAPLYVRHPFWDTQPVPHFIPQQEKEAAKGEIEKKDVKDVRTTPYPLPAEMEWTTIDITNDKELNEAYELLKDNYVEDSAKNFRFKYSAAFLRWALTPPNYVKDWILGIRVKANHKLVGFISGIPIKVCVEGKPISMAEINFLCVHSKLRTKRVAPVLIKEVTRRINLTKVWQAIYTGGKYIPTPISESFYHYRCLNFKKLNEIGFVSIPPKSSLKRQEKIYKLPEAATIPGLRKMVKKDAKQVQELLAGYLKKFAVYPEFTQKEIKHYFTPKENIVDSYVVEGADKKLTDFVSFYTVDCGVLKHESIQEYKGAYTYYYAATKTPLVELMRAALVCAANSRHDIFFCLNVMDNKKYFEDLRFTQGSGKLMYYMYNYAMKGVQSDQLGMILV